MKIPPATSDAFVLKPNPACHAVLLYGPDAGLVSMRAKTLHHSLMDQPNDPFRNISIDYKNIKKDPALLGEALYARSLMGGKRCITIIDAEPSLPKMLIELLKEYNGEHVCIWLAGELPAASSLRKLFENEKRLAAVACYKDDSTSIRPVILHYFKTHGMTASQEAIAFLSYHCPGDRMMVIRELEKLVLYKGNEKTIDLHDVEACINPHDELSLDVLCHAVASGNAKAMEVALAQALDEGVGAISIIRTLMYYFMRLHMVNAKINAGEPQQTAISSLRPPLFFKHAPQFKQHLFLWSEQKLTHLLSQLQELENQCKHNVVPPTILLGHFLVLLPFKYKIHP